MHYHPPQVKYLITARSFTLSMCSCQSNEKNIYISVFRESMENYFPWLSTLEAKPFGQQPTVIKLPPTNHERGMYQFNLIVVFNCPLTTLKRMACLWTSARFFVVCFFCCCSFFFTLNVKRTRYLFTCDRGPNQQRRLG